MALQLLGYNGGTSSAAQQASRTATVADVPGSSDFTVALRFKITAGSASTVDVCEYNNSSLLDVEAGVTGQTGQIHLRVSAGDEPSLSIAGNTDTWLLAVAIYDDTAGTSDFYLYNADTGSLIDSATDQSTGTLAISAGQLEIQTGTIVDARFYDYSTWSVALSPSEVATLATAESDQVQGANLVRRYVFDRTTGTVAGTESELKDRVDDDHILSDLTGSRLTWQDDAPAALVPSAPQITAASAHENGHWVDVTLQTTSGDIVEPASPAGWSVERDATPVTLTRVQKIADKQLRLWTANGSASRILSGETITVGYDQSTGSTVDEGAVEVATTEDYSVTNNSEQASDSIFWNSVRHTFADDIEVGITAAGRLQLLDESIELSSQACEPYDGEEQRQVAAMMVGIDAGNADQGASPRGNNYDAGEATSLPYTPSAGDVIVASVVLADSEVGGWQATTAYALGDVIDKDDAGGRYRICKTAGTSGGTEPTWGVSGADTNDGTVVWEQGDDSAVERYSIFEVVSAFKDQTKLGKPWARGATDGNYDIDDFDTDLLPGDSVVGGELSIAAATAKVDLPWVEIGTGFSGNEIIARKHMEGYGRDIAEDTVAIWETLCTDLEPNSQLLAYAMQIGVDYIALRQMGGFWPHDGGHSHGRLTMAMHAAKLLGIDYGVLRTPADGSARTTDWAGWGEAEQTFYVVAADLTRDNSTTYDYGDSGLGTFIDPTEAPSTYSDSPAAGYAPASLSETWLHAPDWGTQPVASPGTKDPRWNEATYRICCTGKDYHKMLDLFRRLGISESDFDYLAWWDYTLRYVNIQAQTRDSRATALDPAFAVTASLDGSTLTVSSNRAMYQAPSPAGWALDDGTLSSWTQTAPRTWTATISEGASPTNLTYTAASGSAVDAGMNDLPDQSVSIQADEPGGGGGDARLPASFRPLRNRRDRAGERLRA